MIKRFIQSARKRGYTALPKWLCGHRQPCLLNTGHHAQDEVFGSARHVTYRVAGLFEKDSFERLSKVYADRHYKPEYDSANIKIKNALQEADSVIYQSRWSKSKLDSLHRRPEGTWRIIPNAVDLRLFRPSFDWPRKSTDTPVLGLVGSMRYRPRLEVLFDIAGRLPKRPRLLIVGRMDSFCREALESMLRDSSWRNNIEYVPSVHPDRLIRYYRRMDCLVHTVAGDSCPNVVVEALACGVPVVCPEEGGTVELVERAGIAVSDPDGLYGEVLRCGMTEGVKRILKELPLFQRLARRRAEENNDLEMITSQYLQTLGFPPRPWRGGYRYVGTRVFGSLGSAITKRRRSVRQDRPKIGLILWDWNLGGIASWMFRLTKVLTEYEFHFIATHLEAHAPQCETNGVFAYKSSFWQMREYLRKQGIQLVQVSNNRWPIDAARAAGVRRIIERTDGTRSCCVVPKKDLDCVIVSAAGTLPLIRRFWPGVHCEVVYNAVDLKEIDATPIDRRAPHGCVAIGRCTRFGWGKRLDLLLNAFRHLRAKDYPVHLTLAGEDSRLPGAAPVEADLRRQASSFGDSVTLLGRTENPLPLTKGWDIGVCCSDPFNEGIPNSLIEPMACGIPVVATDIDQVRELVEDGVNGLLVPPRDEYALSKALELLVCNPEIRASMGRAARRTIEDKFSFLTAVSKYRKTYERLLKLEAN